MKNLIIFDLDGTLIDSSESIFDAFRYSAKLNKLSYVSKKKFISSIGPKISELFDKFYKDKDKKENFIKNFRYSYDDIYLLNFKKKFVKKSIENLKKKYQLIILTNKPCKPSKTIINHMGLSKTFFKIIGIDFYDKKKATKEKNLKKFLKMYKYENKIYVGDTLEDKNIADIFKCKFLCVKSKYEWQKEDKKSINMFNKVNKVMESYIDKIQ